MQFKIVNKKKWNFSYNNLMFNKNQQIKKA